MEILLKGDNDWSLFSSATLHHPPQASQSQSYHHWSLGAGEVILVHRAWTLASHQLLEVSIWVAEAFKIFPPLGYHLVKGVTWTTTVTRQTHIYCRILPLPSPGGHPQVLCLPHPLPPPHPQHGCQTTWRHPPLPTVTAARGGGTCSQ